MANESYTCQKCGKMMSANQFYTYKNGTKVELCKKCLTMHIDNFDDSTYLWILEKLDLPYLPIEWNLIRDKAYAKNPKSMNGMSVLGKYISKMKLKQFKSYGFADTERLQEEYLASKVGDPVEVEPEFADEMRTKMEAGEISEAQYRTLVSTPEQFAADIQAPVIPESDPAIGSFYDESAFMAEEDLPDPGANLTEDDKLYLAMKWGRLYKPNEWIELEQKWNEMKESFDIQDADTEGTLLLICKTFLKMNQAVDCGDMDGYQKLSRVYDTLRKSAKFTAAQNKEQTNQYIDSIGELVALCERQGFIPRYVIDTPQDVVDVTLKDMNNYVYKLVTQDLGFGQQIDDSLQKIQIQKELQEAEDNNDTELGDTDFEQFYAAIEEQKQITEDIYDKDEI